jgi:hypothetical protein
MGKLDKDIYQKEYAIRFCVLSGHIPFLEVNVENQRELSDTSTVITDIDVLGVFIDASGSRRRVIFDCKTLGKSSPINRAFWAAGLMKYALCNEAFVILRKKASEAHRLSAKHINVHLFNEKQFANYAEAYSLDFKVDYCYSTNIDNWISHDEIYLKTDNFKKFGHFLNSEIPLETDATRGLKRLLAALQKGKGEFNPEKPAHLAIFHHALMIFIFLMSQIVHDLKNVIDFDANKNDFEKLLKYYIWGGKESFLQRQKMAKLFADSNHDPSMIEPSLQEWDTFVELTRKLLDSPSEVAKCCFPMREISFRNIVAPVKDKDLFLAKTIKSNNRIRQFITSQARYLVKAVKLPHEFETELSAQFDELKNIIDKES